MEDIDSIPSSLGIGRYQPLSPDITEKLKEFRAETDQSLPTWSYQVLKYQGSNGSPQAEKASLPTEAHSKSEITARKSQP